MTVGQWTLGSHSQCKSRGSKDEDDTVQEQKQLTALQTLGLGAVAEGP